MTSRKPGSSKGARERAQGSGGVPSHVAKEHTNMVVVVGEVAREVSSVQSTDGQTYSSLDVVCHTTNGRSVVPVTVTGDFFAEPGQRVALIGRVHKRFYSSGAGLASRTDVRADRIVVIRRRDQVSRVISEALALLGNP